MNGMDGWMDGGIVDGTDEKYEWTGWYELTDVIDRFKCGGI